MSACSLSDRRYIALLCSYTFSVLLLHCCVLFVFPLSLYYSQRTSTPLVCMSVSVLRTKHKAPNAGGISYLFFFGMNKSTVYFLLAFIHVVRMFVVALSLHLSRGRLCLRMHCLIDGMLLFCVHTHLAFFFYIVAYCLCYRCRCTIHSQRMSTPRVCMSISVGNRIDGIFLFCIETHRSVLFVVTPSSCCLCNVQA